jgi:dephospho-CoA kinase
MERRLSATKASYCLLVIPLLFETGQAELVDRVLVVDAPREQQIRRTQDRDGVTRKSVEGILRTQLGRRARLERADDLIRNDSDLAHLGQQVQALHRCYQERSGGDLPGTNG